MTTKHFASFRRRRRGLTLVEVLAGTLLLGTLLVSVVLADAALTAQSRAAARRVEACRVADELLDKWWPDRDEIPHIGAGKVPGRDRWRWRTHPLNLEGARELGAEVVAVEIFSADAESDQPAARVEILLPVVEGNEDPGTDTD